MGNVLVTIHGKQNDIKESYLLNLLVPKVFIRNFAIKQFVGSIRQKKHGLFQNIPAITPRPMPVQDAVQEFRNDDQVDMEMVIHYSLCILTFFI